MANENIEFDIIVNGKKAKTSIEDVEKAQEELDGAVKKSTKAIGISWVKLGATIAATAYTLKKAFDFAKDIDTINTRLEVATGSVEAATSKFGDLEAMALELGLSLEGLASSYASFRIASDLAGTSLQDTEKIFNSVSVAAAAMKLSADQTDGAFKALEQMMSKGTVQAEELRGQLGERLPGAFSLAAKAMGVSTMELGKMMEKGELLASDLLPKLADELNNKFASGAVKASNSIQASYNRLGNVFTDFKGIVLNVLDNLGLIEYFSGAIKAVDGFTSSILRTTKALGDMTALERQKERADLTKELTEAQEDLNDAIKNQGGILAGYYGHAQVAHKKEIERIEAKLAALDKLDAKEKAMLEAAKNKAMVTPPGILDRTDGKEFDNTAFEKSMKENIAITKEFEDTYANAIGSMSNALSNFVMTGEIDFKQLANSIIADIVRMESQALSSYLFRYMLGGGGGIPAGALGSSDLYHTGTAEVKHTGGMIGNIPSYHSGLRADERMAKLQVGEAVINRSGAANNQDAINAMNRGEKVGGGGNTTTAEIIFNVQAIDAASFDTYLATHKKTIEGIISSSIAGNGSVRKVIKQSL